MATGKIKFFKGDKGFGFISGDDGPECFFHISKVEDGMIPVVGQRVTYYPVHGKKGMEAQSVTIENGSTTTAVRGGGRTAPASKGPTFFPYGFVRRQGGQLKTTALHHQVNHGGFDFAVDVTWTTETPTALAACEDPGISASAINREGENNGYNKRWLTVGGCLAISPFTVKGAVANAFANLMGGCFRVPDREEGHNHAINASTYPYTGKWKRYRVAMNMSHAGVIKEIDLESGKIKIQPAQEYYLEDNSLPAGIKPGDACQADWAHPVKRNGQPDRNKRFIISGTIKPLLPGKTAMPGQTALIYCGPYRFGMNLELKPGDLGKRHHHRFCEEKGGVVHGEVDPLALANLKRLKEKVYAGQFCKGEASELKPGDPRRHKLGEAWYEDLSTLKPGDFCYFTTFDDPKGKNRIVAIGKNFQFKALFDHAATIPPANETCIDKGLLCPRCSLFGIADKTEGNNEAVGYAGRFRSATLTSDVSLREDKIDGHIPANETLQPQQVKFFSWFAGERLIARQFALPIMGAPKPSKRDQDGYFDMRTGRLKGAKRYHHSHLAFDNSLPSLIRETDGKKLTEEGMPYGHKMRPVAPVCREGITFRGTLGCENSRSEEAAGLLMVLDQRVAGHRFKLGLGKSRGMGSVSPRIDRIWIRDPANREWQWRPVDIPPEGNREALLAALEAALPKVAEDLKLMCTVKAAMYRADKVAAGTKEGKPDFPAAGNKYWRQTGLELF